MGWSSLWLETVGDPYNRTARSRLLDKVAIFLGGERHETYEWESLTRSDMERLKRFYVESGFTPATVRYYLVTLRSLATLICDEGAMTLDRLRSRRRSELPPKSGSGHVGRKLSQEECTSLFSVRATSAALRMRKAMFGVLITTGVRASELCSMETSNLDGDGILTILGKGQKRRHVSLVLPIKEVLDEHRNDCDEKLPWLLQNVVGVPCKLDRRRVLRDMRYLAEEAEVDRFCVHDCRRTAASVLMDSGIDVFTVADLLGHSSVDTTRMYDRRPYEEKLKAMEYLGGFVQGRG